MANVTHAEVFPRSLTPREAEILDFMLGVDDPRTLPLREQRESVVVTGLCGCGCASINLAVDRKRCGPAPLCGQPISADPDPAAAADASAVENCGVLLFLDDGWLGLLEICWLAKPVPEFPPATAFCAPEVTCERDAAAIEALDRHPRDAGAVGSLGDGVAAIRRLLHRRRKP